MATSATPPTPPRIDGKLTTVPESAGNHLVVNRECNSTSPYKSNSEDDGVATVQAKCVCPYCDLVCSKPSVLEKHLRAHTNERPYPCLPCGFSFKTRSNLLKHCRTSRSHSLKLEEAGVENNTSMVSRGGLQLDEDCDETEDDAMVSTTSSTTSLASIKDSSESSSNDENKAFSTENVPRTGIYKPKFHKAIYTQNNAVAPCATATIASKSISGTVEPSTMNKLGLQLKIPASGNAAHNSSASSTPSTPSPFTSGSSPSPEFLHRHISKLISENQAIVETTDPFWSKKFYQRSKEGSPSSPLSNSSSSSIDSSFKKIPAGVVIVKPSTELNIEDKLPVESKLAHALLQPRVVKAATAIVPGASETFAISSASSTVSVVVEDTQPLNLSICKDTRPKSYLDEEDDKTATQAEYGRLMAANEPANRFVPNGRLCSAGEVYPKDTHHHHQAFVKATTSATLPDTCSLCDETFDNYDKLKTHILYQCKGNKNHSLSSTASISNQLGSVNHKSTGSGNDARVFLRVGPSDPSSIPLHQLAKANANQSPGPRLGNTPLIGGYKKLSVITTTGGPGPSLEKCTTTSTKNNQHHVLIEQHKTVTSLKSLEELSNAPMKGANHFVYNAALMDDAVDKSSLKVATAECKEEAKNSIIVSKTACIAEDTKLISIKCASMVAAKPKDASGVFKSSSGLAVDLATLSKTTSSATVPKISQFVIPVVQGVPNLATIQSVQAAALLAATTNSDIHSMSPISAAAAGYKTPTTPTAALPKAKSTHVNGGVVTILHGGKVIPYVPGMPGPQSAAAAFLQVDGYEKKSSEAVKRKYDDGGPINGMIKHPNHQRIEELPSPSTPQGAKIFHGVKIKEEIVSSVSIIVYRFV